MNSKGISKAFSPLTTQSAPHASNLPSHWFNTIFLKSFDILTFRTSVILSFRTLNQHRAYQSDLLIGLNFEGRSDGGSRRYAFPLLGKKYLRARVTNHCVLYDPSIPFQL